MAPGRSWSRATGRSSTGCRFPAARPPCSSSGSASRTGTRSASPCTCRTTWPRPPIPPRALPLLEAIDRPPGLSLPADALREAARRTDLEITRQVEGSDEVTEVVRSLEEQYDAFTADREGLLAQESEAMPTAEELGAQFEQFLAEQQGKGEPPDA